MDHICSQTTNIGPMQCNNVTAYCILGNWQPPSLDHSSYAKLLHPTYIHALKLVAN